jgi:tetratricopeptide (TPR) repeat protein
VLIPLLGILILLAIAAMSGLAGYRSGIGMRTEAEKTLVSEQAREQFDLGVQDMQAGFFERARQRFEYVIRLDPAYPGAADMLAEVLLEINTTATPTTMPTPTLTPTPDTRGIDGLFDTANQQMSNNEWDTAIETLLRLRKQDPTYRAVNIDGMLFLALRNRGMDKIAKQADLEGGLYDLALAARFGPLDNEAQGYMNWTTLYLTGASFWDLDWRQVVSYFEQIAPQLPYLTDGSGLTAIERYRLGLIGLGDTLMREGDYCTAVDTYTLALSYGSDAEAELALQEATDLCSGDQEPTPDDSQQPAPTVDPNAQPTTDPNATPPPPPP